jgi:Glycosyl hydrolase family 20, domain 2/Carbohydrate family 9 binding domain-like/Glycosyl hydrolase family 20, catalytic domain
LNMEKEMKKIFIFIFVMASLCVTAKRNESIPRSGKDNVLILFPVNNKWSVNNYKKRMKCFISNLKEKTPGGNSVINIKLSGKGGGCNIVAPRLAAGGAWRQSKYKAITLYTKGISGTDKVQMVAYSSDGRKFSWSVNIRPDKWQKNTLLISNAYNKQGDKLDVSKLHGMYLASPRAVDFKFGGIKLISVGSDFKVVRQSAVMLPVCDIAPKLDGLLSDAVWKKAPKMSMITIKEKVPGEKTEIRILTAKGMLYIGAKLFTPDTTKLVASKKKRDGSVYLDDCLEVFINERLDGKSYRHIVVNSIGTLQDYQWRFDQTKEAFIYDRAWNPDVKVKSRLTGNCWTVEMEIPLQQLGLKIEQPFSLQVGRENPRLKEYSTIALTKRFTQVDNFLLTCLGNYTAKVRSLALQYTQPDNFILHGQTNGQKLNGQLIIADPAFRTFKIPFSKNAKFNIPVKLKSPLNGEYAFVVNAKGLVPERLRFNLRLPSEINFGDLYLNPLPKQLKKKSGSFNFYDDFSIVIATDASKRTRKTARFLRSEIMNDMFGMNCSITDEPATSKRFNLSIVPKFGNLPPEGYSLKITPDSVNLTAVDEAGLYYAVVTLRQIARTMSLKNHAPELPCLEILDWPDLKHRMVVNNLVSYRRKKSPHLNVNEIKRFIKEVVAGSKWNIFSLQLKYAFEFDKHSKVTILRSKIPKEKIAEIARFCKENFVEFIPALQSGGHSQFLTRRFKGLQDSEYDHRQSNVLYPDYYKILFDMYKDILDAVPDVKYFHILHDEWWQHPKKDHVFKLNGIPRWQLFANDVKKIHAFFKKRNIKILMYADMLLPEHNGGGILKTAQALEQLPKDIIMTNWSIRSCPGSSMYLYKKGFEVWDTVNQFRCVSSQDKKIISGYGTLAYLHSWQTFWYSRDKILPDYSHGPFRGGQYAWNLQNDAGLPINEWRNRYMNSVNAMYFYPKRRAKKLKFRMISLDKVANSELKDWFNDGKAAPHLPVGQTKIGFTPFILPKDKVVAAAKKYQEVIIPINKNLKGLIFLQGCYVPKAGIKLLKERSKDYQYGVPVGEIRIEYATGASVIIPLRFGMNTLNIRPLPQARFMFDTRFTYDLKTVDGTAAALYTSEWTNEYDRRTIRRVVLKTYDTPAVPVIFAITGYSEKK